MTSDLHITKRSFNINLYEFETVFNNEEVVSFISKEVSMVDKEMLTTFFEKQKNILENEKLKNFSNFITDHIDVFCKNVLHKNKFLITNSWLQAYKQNSWHSVHTHENNITSYSLIFYIQTSENSSNTLFYTPGFPYTPSQTLTIKAKQNKFIIFPGYIPHEVPPNKDNERIVFSANFEILD